MIRVSNGMGLCNFLGQKDRSFFIVLGQRNNRASSKSCHGTRWEGIFTGCPIGQEHTHFQFCTINALFFNYDFLFQNIFSCFRTPFPVLELPFLFQKVLLLFPNQIFPFKTNVLCSRGCLARAASAMQSATAPHVQTVCHTKVRYLPRLNQQTGDAP